MKIVFLFLIAVWCLPVSVQAAAPPGEPPAKIRLLAFSRVGEDMEVNIVDPEGATLSAKPVALPTQQLSSPAVVTTKALIFTAVSDPKKILGKVVLPSGGGEFVLIFLPAPDGSPEAYRVQAVSLPASGFGSGDYAFINYSGTTVGCDIAGERMQIVQGASSIYSAAKSGKGQGNRTLVCYSKKDGAWEKTPFLSSRMIVQDGVRNLVFICRNPKTGAIEFRGIPDFLK